MENVREYRVSWAVDVEATSPLDAARQAEEIVLSNTSRIWVVKQHVPAERTIDLETGEDL